MKTNKYNYLKVIQQNYGQGWEDVSEYETNSTGTPKEYIEGSVQTLFRHDLKEYKMLGYPTRVINRKEIAQKIKKQ
jgi:hypothetical protein